MRNLPELRSNLPDFGQAVRSPGNSYDLSYKGRQQKETEGPEEGVGKELGMTGTAEPGLPVRIFWSRGERPHRDGAENSRICFDESRLVFIKSRHVVPKDPVNAGRAFDKLRKPLLKFLYHKERRRMV